MSHTTGADGREADARSLAAALLRAIELARHPAPVDACRGSAAPYDWDTGLAPLLERLYAGEGEA